MIYTTYFAKLRSLPTNVIPISICGKAPVWYTGLQYKKLAPKYDFFIEWKKTHDNDYYIQHFNDEVLSSLDVAQVVSELQHKVTEATKLESDFHIALVCYEKPTDFCHRHLVSKWLCENGIECKEWGID